MKSNSNVKNFLMGFFVVLFSLFALFMVFKDHIFSKEILTSKDAVICACVKKENIYVDEWVDYHLKLGFKKIYIHDNNDGDTDVSIFDNLKNKYSSKIEIIDKRNQKYEQDKWYLDFYNGHAKSFKWCAFIDIDEFITLKKHKNINEYLNEAENNGYNIVCLNWMTYGANGHITQTQLSVLNRFTKPAEPLNQPINTHVKSIWKSGLTVTGGVPLLHTPTGDNLNYCNGNLQKITLSDQCFQPISDDTYDTAFIRHLYTRSWEEWKRYKNDQAFGGIEKSKDFFLGINNDMKRSDLV